MTTTIWSSGNFWVDKIRKRQPLAMRIKQRIQNYLTAVLPDPPPTASADTHSLTFSVSAIGLNEILPSVQQAREIVEVYFLMEGGANTVSLEAEEKIILPAQAYAANVGQVIPAFDLPQGRALQVRIVNATKVSGRVVYRTLDPGIVVGGY